MFINVRNGCEGDSEVIMENIKGISAGTIYDRREP